LFAPHCFRCADIVTHIEWMMFSERFPHRNWWWQQGFLRAPGRDREDVLRVRKGWSCQNA
jgi:hypothetical protein